jgi:hypothetical protein
VKRPLALSLAALALAACGGGSSAAPGPGWRSFDIIAMLTLTPPAAAPASFTDFPATHAFTLAWNAQLGQGLVGAQGSVGNFVTLPSADGSRLQTGELVPLPVAFADGCAGVAQVQYDDLTVSIAGDALTGTAHGHARFQSGDQIFEAQVTAALAGVPDATAPRLLVPASPVDPLAGLRIAPSEPIGMPVPPAQPALVGDNSGDVVPLLLAQSAGSFVSAFTTDGRALRHGETYKLRIDGLMDFASHPVVTMPPSFTTPPAPPLVPEDGFESVTTPTFGGAGVLHGEPLTPIAGTTSLVLNTGVGGGFGFLPYHLGPSVALRLVVSSGDTVVRFQSQLVTVYELPEATFFGEVRVASPGGAVGRRTNITATGFAKVTLPVDGDVYIAPPATIEVPLPAGTTGEIVFEIAGVTFGCGLPPPPTALIIDDLRVE